MLMLSDSSGKGHLNLSFEHDEKTADLEKPPEVHITPKPKSARGFLGYTHRLVMKLQMQLLNYYVR